MAPKTIFVWFVISILAVAVIGIATLLPQYMVEKWLYQFDIYKLDVEKQANLMIALRKSAFDWVQLIFGGATAIGLIGTLVYTARNFGVAERTLAISHQSKITESFAKAIEQLSNDEQIMKIGALYLLSRIALNGKSDHQQIMRLLNLYIQKHAHKNIGYSITRDVQVALDIVRNRNTNWDGELIFDFSNTDLSNSDIVGIVFRKAVFEHSNLTGTDFSNSILEECNFSNAVLNGTIFENCDLRGCSFKGATLDAVQMINAKLEDACFAGSSGTIYATKIDLKRIKGQNAKLQFLNPKNVGD